MNCASCGGPLKPRSTDDALVCEYCHNVFYAQKNDDGVVVLGESHDEPCPVCAIPLMNASLERAEIRYCNRCHGMLVPMNGFPEIIDALRERNPGRVDSPPFDPEEMKRKLTCPHCHQPMTVDFYPAATNVVVGLCERCSLDWVDHGKMARIVDGARRLREVDQDMAAERLNTDYQF
jgi:Zn-finger nucleic acid-binding protein